MKKYTVISALALTCLTLQAEFRLDGVRFGGYSTNVLIGTNYSIVAVPFSGFDTTEFTTTNLSLNSLICTNGIPLGSRLIAFDEAKTNYYYYSLTSTNWNPLTFVDIEPDSTNHVGIAPELSTVLKAQGYAFWLKTPNGVATAILQGVVNTNASRVAIAAGTSFTLVGNALPTPLDLNSDSFTNNTWFLSGFPGKGDEIHVVVDGKYKKNLHYNGAWRKIEYTPSNTVYSAVSDSIPAGSGMWYLRRGTSAETLIIK